MIKIDRHVSGLLMLLWLPLLIACADDVFSGNENNDGELPVTFEFVLPSATRSDNNLIQDRTSFKNKDVIHIEGTFTCTDGEIKIRYGAMSYDAAKKSWTAVDKSELTWPDDADAGSFKAYFVQRREDDSEGGIIQTGGQTPTYSMSDLTYENDPLSAETKEERIPYGHAVKLNFEHICTYLTLKGLGAKVADTYWFTQRNKTLNNAFYLKRNADNTLTFTFCQKPDPRYHRDGYTDALVYINTTTVTEVDGTKAKFFLPPGNYDSFTLCYPGAESNFFDYLEYTYVPSQGESEIGPYLESNHSYLLDISKSKGITISSPPPGPSEETWDDSDNDYIHVNVKDFLKAVANGTDYYYDKTQILQGGSNSTKLLHNISFDKTSYSRETFDFEPIVKEGSVFDGGHHYIRDIACPVFHRNRGTIRNLGLRNIDAEFISDEADMGKENKDEYDQSRNGILCGWNERGTVENIRIAGAKIIAKVKNDTETTDDKDASQEAHNIGCVIGSNTGTVTDVALAGTFTLTVDAYTDGDYSNKVDASVMIGGIVGQNAEHGSISNVAPYEDADESVGELVFRIENKCIGELGAFYVGGVAGLSSAYISNVTLPAVSIDGSDSKCVAMYMGGIAGQLSATGSDSGTTATSLCTITGTVKAGAVYHADRGDIAAKSYIGGISGVLGQSITDCRTAVSVSVGTDAHERVMYATGGAFGRILKTMKNISLENIMAYGMALTGPTNYIGDFAGIVPVGKTWEDSYKDLNIIVQNHVDNYIGHNQDTE